MMPLLLFLLLLFFVMVDDMLFIFLTGSLLSVVASPKYCDDCNTKKENEEGKIKKTSSSIVHDIIHIDQIINTKKENEEGKIKKTSSSIVHDIIHIDQIINKVQTQYLSAIQA